MAAQGRLKVVRGAAKRFRRALVPEYEALIVDVPEAHRMAAEVRAEIERLRARVDELDQRVRNYEDGLQEARSLHLRVAELTDVVTEVVLPLHDREIDAEKFERLAPEPL